MSLQLSTINPITCTNLMQGYTTTVTASGTTTLDTTSTYAQFFTGTAAQTVVLPAVSTLKNGYGYEVNNRSTGTVTVQTSALVTVGTIPTGSKLSLVCIDTTGSGGIGGWYSLQMGGVDVVLDSAATPKYPQNLTDGIWYGSGTKASGHPTSIRIGNGSTATPTGAITIGNNATNATGPSSITIGAGATNTGNGNCILIGPNGVLESGNNGESIGIGASVNLAQQAYASTAVGKSASISNPGGTAIGHTSTSINGGQAFGINSYANQGSVAAGPGARAEWINQVAIGNGAICLSGATGVIAIGSSAVANATSTFAIGTGAQATGTNSMVVGHGATCPSSGSMAVGLNATVPAAASGCTIIGGGASCSGGNNSTVLGSGAFGAAGCIAIGAGANSPSGGSIAIGNSSVVAVAASGCVLIGNGTTCGSGNNSTVVGNGGYAASNACAFGTSASASVSGAVALGPSANANVANAICIGSSATPLSASYALALTTNSASVTPGSFGMTLNGAAKTMELYSSLYASTATSTTPLSLTSTSAQYQYLTGTVAQNVMLPPVNNPTLNNGFNMTISNKSTVTATIYAAGPINGLTTASYTFPLTTITINNVVGTFPPGGGTFLILTTTGLQSIVYTSYAAGVFTFASAGTGVAAIGSIVSTVISSVLTVPTLSEYYLTCNDNTGGNTNGNVNGWYVSPLLSGPLVGDANGPLTNNIVTRLQGNIPIAYAGSNRGFSIGLLNSLGGNTTGLCLGIACTETVGGMAIGNVNNALGTSICLGEGNNASTRGVALGYGNTASGAGYNVAIGNGNNPGASSTSTAIGYSNTISATGNGMVSIGYNNVIGASGSGAILIGQSSTANSANSIVIGTNSSTTGSNAIGIGRLATANVANSIVLNATGAVLSPTDAAHSLALGLNSASVTPGILGLTLNGANSEIAQYSARFATTVSSTTPVLLLPTSAQIQRFSGSAAQPLLLPPASTVTNGFTFMIANEGSANINVSTTRQTTVSAASTLPVTCLNVASVSGFTASGTIYVVSGSGVQTVTYTSLTPAVATITGATTGVNPTVFNAVNSFTVGQLITITVVNPGAYNGTFIVSAASPTTFSVASLITGPYVSGGIATPGPSFNGTGGGSGAILVGGLVRQIIASVSTVVPTVQADIECVDVTAAVGINGWFAPLSPALAFVVLDSAAAPTYPQDLSKGVWYGLNTKANAFDSTCITIGQNADTSNINAIAMGLGASASISSVGIGAGASAGNANGGPSNGSVAIGRNASTTFADGIAIGTNTTAATANNVAVAVGPYCSAANQNGMSFGISITNNGVRGLSLGYQAQNPSGIRFDCIAIGTGSTTGNADNGLAIGPGATAGGIGSDATAICRSANASATDAIAFGRQTTANSTGAMAIGGGTSATAGGSIIIGRNLTNNVANTVEFAPNGAEAFRILDPALGNISYKRVQAVISGTTPTPTAAQLVSGYIQLSDGGNVTLTIGTAGVTGTLLSAYSQLAGNAYVGLTFSCIVVGTGASTTITLSGATNVAANGITPRGRLNFPALQNIELTFINTGANTWDMVAGYAPSPVVSNTTVNYVSRSLTAAEFIASWTTPVDILPNLGSNRYYVFVRAVVEFQYGSTTPIQISGGPLYLRNGTQEWANDQVNGVFNGASYDVASQMVPAAPPGGVGSPYVGTINFVATGSNPYTNVTDGTFRVKIWYMIETFG